MDVLITGVQPTVNMINHSRRDLGAPHRIFPRRACRMQDIGCGVVIYCDEKSDGNCHIHAALVNGEF